MPKEVSAGAIVFRRETGRILYLLLQHRYKTEYWDFAKGNVEKGEQPRQTADREVFEETGLEVELLPEFEQRISWFYKREGQTISKEVFYFLGEAKAGEVKISDEHIGFEWLPYEEALARLTFKNSKELVKKANDFLEKRRME